MPLLQCSHSTPAGAELLIFSTACAVTLRADAYGLTAERVASSACASQDDGTPLHYSAVHGTADGVKALVDAGADLELRTSDGATAAYAAARFGRAESLKILLDAGANPNAEHNTTGNTPLHVAAWEGHFPAVEALLAAGAKLEETNDVRTAAKPPAPQEDRWSPRAPR